MVVAQACDAMQSFELLCTVDVCKVSRILQLGIYLYISLVEYIYVYCWMSSCRLAWQLLDRRLASPIPPQTTPNPTRSAIPRISTTIAPIFPFQNGNRPGREQCNRGGPHTKNNLSTFFEN